MKFKRPLPSYSDTQASARERTPVSIEALWRTDGTIAKPGLRSKGSDLDRATSKTPAEKHDTPDDPHADQWPTDLEQMQKKAPTATAPARPGHRPRSNPGQICEMCIAGDDTVGSAFDGGDEDGVVFGVLFNHLNIQEMRSADGASL